MTAQAHLREVGSSTGAVLDYALDDFLTLVRKHLYRKMESKKWGLPIAHVALMCECLSQLGWECKVVGMQRHGGGAKFALLIGDDLVITPRLMRGWEAIQAAAEKTAPRRTTSIWFPLSSENLDVRIQKCFQVRAPGDIVKETVSEIQALLLSMHTVPANPRPAARL